MLLDMMLDMKVTMSVPCSLVCLANQQSLSLPHCLCADLCCKQLPCSLLLAVLYSDRLYSKKHNHLLHVVQANAQLAATKCRANRLCKRTAIVNT